MTARTFSDLPAHVERAVAGSQRVLVVLLDAFGWRFVERHASHPLLRRLDSIRPLNAQFPSTTAAHVTTMHTGLPVGRHGLYEWNILEPSLGRIVTPLRVSFAGDAEPDTLLAAGFDARRLLPDGPTFYERLTAAGALAWVFHPSRFSPSTFDGLALRGAQLHPYGDLQEAVRDAVDALRPVDRGYAYVYYELIDTVGHLHGPSSASFDATARKALDAVLAGLHRATDVEVLVTADHGQVEVDPRRTLWLDDICPALGKLPLRPAGSGRDVFLHVPQSEVDETLDALRPHVEAHRVSDLLAAGAFGADVGFRLLERLGSVCVLPPAGRMAWLRSAADVQEGFRGHHGGRTPEEACTWLGSWRL